ncbi:hypothetical protein LVD17_19255 [Fulvivirga ulvae]|uniref:hypothetical protein n=1 Tax=Fulvivirga ulvae TaxID=2904245 RepID=UPI001F16B63B|nr:hypothetical protein [Fulvivirga ulvae]UII30433.1 hypothetical protein LVD17_19255 [Fulvivirga ulvae]
MLIKTTLFKFSFIITLLALWSCSGGGSRHENEQVSETPAVQSETATAAKSYYITSSENVSLAEITGSGGELTIITQTGTLFGVMKSEDKRKYYDQNDQFRYAVKFKDDAFKLRNANEELIWKVKIKDGKIKIANNEEMTGAYEIHRYDDGRIKLKQNDNEISAIRYEQGAPRVEVQGKYFLRNFADSYAPGVLLIPEIGEVEKFIICAELAVQGK